MALAVYYRSTRPVSQPEGEAIRAAARAAIEGRTWLGCEPVRLANTEGGHLLGGGKPNFMPHPAAHLRSWLPGQFRFHGQGDSHGKAKGQTR